MTSKEIVKMLIVIGLGALLIFWSFTNAIGNGRAYAACTESSEKTSILIASLFTTLLPFAVGIYLLIFQKIRN